MPLRVNVAVNVLHSVVDDVVNVVIVKVVVRAKRVCIDHRAGFDVRIDLRSQRLALIVSDNHRSALRRGVRVGP